MASHACTYVYMCVCVYLYICIYVCLCTSCRHSHVLAHIFTQAHMHFTPLHMCLQVCMCLHTDLCLLTFLCLYVCLHVYTCMLVLNLSSRRENTGVLTHSWPLPHSLRHTLPLGSLFYKTVCHPSWPRSTEAVTMTGDLESLQCLSGSDSSLGTS